MRPVSRPTDGQRALYNGHFRVHGFKYQGVPTPDGILVDFQGSVQGRTHDLTMLRESGLYDVLEQYARTIDEEPLSIFGDPVCTLPVNLLSHTGQIGSYLAAGKI